MALEFVEQDVNSLVLDVQSLHIAHPVNADALLQLVSNSVFYN